METIRDSILKTIKSLPNINPADVDALSHALQEKNIGLVKALLQRRLISEQDLLALLMHQMRIPSIDLSKYRLDDHLKSIITEKIARQYQVVPLSLLDNTLTVAMSDPLNVLLLDDLRSLTGKTIDVMIASQSQIQKVIDQFYASAAHALAQATKTLQEINLEIIQNPASSQQEEQEAEQAPIIRIVNLIIKEAIRQRASDIHIEATEEGMRVRFRIDGILQDILTIPKENQNAVRTRIKIMAGLDITNFQTPQDGRFKMRVALQEVDFRVSLLPTTFGQKIVMRVLDKNNLSIGLSKLGFSSHAVKHLEEAIEKPFGMILITGPTGSGKSTTLYSLINKLNTAERNIITIEEPVEYLVDGLTQIEVKPEIGLTFAAGLRAILRQSPDVVMVGEIRDAETADIAIKASLTGQLVLSTLHTNDAAGAVTRLVDMGLEPFLVASSLIVICAQRLCRRICSHCKRVVAMTPALVKRIQQRIKVEATFYEGAGCDRCRGTGYLGRLGITEILLIDDAIREMVLKGQSSAVLAAYAQKNGMKLLFDDILEKAIQGETSLTEVFRLTSQEE